MSTAAVKLQFQLNCNVDEQISWKDNRSHPIQAGLQSVLRPNLSILSSNSCRLVWNFALTVLAW